jgi:MFS family permease
MKYWRIYLATLVNTFGSWCTFLAIALLTKENYGIKFVPLIFLAQTLPVVFLSRSMIKIVKHDSEEKWYFLLQILFTLNSLILLFDQSLPVIFIHLLLSATFKGLSGPLFNNFIGRWAPQIDRTVVYTRVDALTAGALTLAPLIGAWIKIKFSFKVLFVIDAISFMLALILLLPYLKSKITASTKWVEKAALKKNILFSSLVSLPLEFPKMLILPLTMWLIYQLLGALLNGIEFATFERHQMTATSIGYTLTAWGAGSLITFIAGKTSVSKASFVYFLALVLLIVAPNTYFTACSFMLAGFSYSVLSGGIRALLIGAVPNGYNPLPIWAYANQMTQLQNLIVYSLSAILLNPISYFFMAFGLLIAAFTLWIIVRYYDKQKPTSQLA